MQTNEDRIKELEEEIRKTPYHKGTEHHIGKLKARIARLKEEQIEKAFKGKGGGGGGYAIRSTGDATVVLVGPPSVGKSTLLNRLTNADSKIGAYDFTTLNVIPGMLDFKGAKIQIFDVPGIVSGAASGKGRGKEVLAVARNADLIVIMVDIKTVKLIPQIIGELREAGVRLNEKKPEVTILKKPSGGIKVNSTTSLKLSYDTIRSLAGEFRLANAEIIIKEDITLDRLVDAFIGNRVYLPFVVVVNKIDLGSRGKEIPEIEGEKPIFISSQEGKNLETLKEEVWKRLKLIRVYLKEGENIDYDSPLVIKEGLSLREILENISLRNKENLNSAKVFGPGAKYPGQEVSFSFVPLDETVVQFVS
ncbi:GTP-binding protein [Candidatus Microgenomates bacterium]|jgi:small GTP-binding protein|nr:MAG: GTP-binding protein [Candidatus Microgenomates bacterium]